MIHRAVRFAALLVTVLEPSLLGQTASLVKDIAVDPTAPGLSAQPGQFMPVGDKVFFFSRLNENGSPGELWVTDGTSLGTEPLGVCCSPQILGNDGHLLFFSLDAEGPGLQLWRSDGTRRGTFPLSRPDLSISSSGLVAGGRLFFQGCIKATGCDLWSTDGSNAGTRLVADLPPFAGTFGPLVAVGSQVFFLRSNELWRSDGTAAGTVLVRRLSLNPNLGHSLMASGNRLFFSADGGTDGQELWVSDGTTAGTAALTQAFRSLSFLKTIGQRLYFLAGDFTSQELWVSDGTTAGTRRLTEFSLDRFRPFDSLRPEMIQEVNGRLLFWVSGPSSGELWTLPVNATAPLLQLCGTGDCPRIPAEENALVVVGDRAVFAAQDEEHGREPWVTDGTAAGTRRLADVCPGECRGIEAPPVAFLGAAFFVAKSDFDRNDMRRSELWRSDGTTAGTRRFAVAEGLQVSDSPGLTFLRGRVLFVGSNGAGVELWSSTGPSGTTQPVADLLRVEPGSLPLGLTSLGERLVFTASNQALGRTVWTTTGTEPATVPLLEAESPGDSGGIGVTTTRAGGRSGDLAYFWRHDLELWRTDGTAAGTFRLAERPEASTFHQEPLIAGLANRALILVPREESTPDDLLNRIDLWVSDGTAAGTRRFVTLPNEASDPSPLAVLGSEAFFTADNDETGRTDLWRTDGTAAGTRRISGFESARRSSPLLLAQLGSVQLIVESFPSNRIFKLGPGDTVSRVVDFFFSEISSWVEYQGAIYFVAFANQGFGLWRTDGTAAGTRVVREFFRDGGTEEIVVSGGSLFFTALDGEHGRELWRSDGTAAGTVMVRDIAEGSLGSEPSQLTEVGGRLFFIAGDRFHGRELWQSDGTTAGTKLVEDLAPGPASSLPSSLTPAPGQLYFTADNGVSGYELWVVPLSSGACQPSTTRLCLKGGRFQVESVWKDFSGNVGVGHAVSLTGDTGYFWFFDPANVELVTKVLDAQTLNEHFWVFYGALSSVQYTLTVTDTQTGATRRYTNFPGELASVGDTRAFGPLGSFSQTPSLTAAPLISERSDLAATAPCVARPRRLCLNGGRFAVEARWKDFQNHTGNGTAVGLTGDTGYFWFFDPANVEVVLKVLDGRELNGKFWVFYGALSNVEYTLTVSDSQTGAVRTYANPSGRFASFADTGAF